MKKRIFIGSSKKAEGKANYIKGILKEFGATNVILWTDPEAYPVSHTTIDSLIWQTNKYDGAVFIMNDDDELAKPKDGNHFIPRDNVLIETGLFMNALGKESVILFRAEDVHIPSDFSGLTTVRYNIDNNLEKMRALLEEWYLRTDIKNNVFMKSRKDIHEIYTLDERLHISDDVSRIRHIRIMNMAANLIINPKYANVDHRTAESINLSDAIIKILQNQDARVDLVLLEPNEHNIQDIQTKIANDVAGSPEGALYSSLATMYYYLYGKAPNAFKDARQRHAFFFKVMSTSMPFAIFNVEFKEPWAEYNHVKVDLYSASLSNENDRRSFVIWQEKDPDNYNFYVKNFEQIYGNKQLTKTVTRVDLNSWKKEWEKRKSNTL